MGGTLAKLIECLASQVQRHRKLKNLSQEALGRATGLSKQAIWNIEHAKTGTSFETIGNLAKALCVDESDLIAPSRPIERSLEELSRKLEAHSDALAKTLISDPLTLEINSLLPSLNEEERLMVLTSIRNLLSRRARVVAEAITARVKGKKSS